MAAGARFIRADLHVHSFPDDGSPAAEPKDYITEARSQDISVLGITDHNSIANVRSFIEAASGQLLVLPGIEVTTHQGHLLALFGPDRLDALQAFATRENLKLTDDRDSKATRSSRSILDLVGDIYDRGGLAIGEDIQDPIALGAHLRHAIDIGLRPSARYVQTLRSHGEAELCPTVSIHE